MCYVCGKAYTNKQIRRPDYTDLTEANNKQANVNNLNNNPVAATPECLDMLKGLIKEHGPLKHIVVGSVALEHKVYAGVLAQKFPDAQVWLTPGQYSFPVNLPDAFLGFPLSRTKDIPKPEDAPQEWKNDFDFLTLGPLISRYVFQVILELKQNANFSVSRIFTKFVDIQTGMALLGRLSFGTSPRKR